MKQSNEWLKCFHEANCRVFEHKLLTVERGSPAQFLFTDMVRVKNKQNKTNIYTLIGRARHLKKISI